MSVSKILKKICNFKFLILVILLAVMGHYGFRHLENFNTLKRNAQLSEANTLSMDYSIDEKLDNQANNLSYTKARREASPDPEKLKNVIAEAKLGDNAQNYDKPFILAQGFADLAEFATPSVVNISAIKIVKNQSLDMSVDNPDPIIRELLKNMLPQQQAPQEQKLASVGSGFVVRSDGFIITNFHVIQGSENIQVTFSNGNKFNALVYAIDELTDLAVLKIEAKGLPSLKFADSDKVRVGDWVIAIGNPFGLGGTVSSGIVSATGRDINIGTYNDFLQTDAAINRGNSGGPMINSKGEVIGINTAIFSTAGGGSIGIGFLVPANTIKNVVSQLIANKTVVRGWIGVQIQGIDDNIAKALGLENNYGALVSRVLPEGPAAKAGIKAGDIILKVDGVEIKNSRILPKIISSIVPKTKAKLDIISNKAKKEVTIIIEEIPVDASTLGSNLSAQDLAESAKIKEATFADIGIKVAEVNDAVRKFFSLDAKSTGIIIIGVRGNSIAQQKGLYGGVRILSVNQVEVQDITNLTNLINKNKKNGLLFLVEDLNKGRYFISLTKKEIDQGYAD
ncbi:Do/DegQ family serine endopeptidase [Candidatus Hepatincolaceae symbiont of Richtersius coronifer]